MFQKQKNVDDISEDEYDYALFGGEDFELLYTVSKENLDKVHGFLIGESINKREVKLISKGEETLISDSGYDHFSHDGL